MRSDDIVVSCLMPTHARRHWLPAAVAGFLRQPVASAELVIVSEDGFPASLLRLSPRLRHVACPPKLPLGEKRNLACAAARGRYLLHWDDDDLQASGRVIRQLRTLAAAGGGVTGSSRVHFRDTKSGRCWEYAYRASELPWVHGATLAYTRAYWRRHPFPAVSVGEDNLFVWSAAPGELQDTRDTGLCLCSLHRHNTSAKNTADAWWRSIPLPRRWQALIRATDRRAPRNPSVT